MQAAFATWSITITSPGYLSIISPFVHIVIKAITLTALCGVTRLAKFSTVNRAVKVRTQGFENNNI